jgi:hypothetical protein
MNKNKTVIVSVVGGISYVDYSPDNIDVIIIDYDNINDDEQHCPVCNYNFEEGFPEDGVCINCGFDINDVTKQLE